MSQQNLRHTPFKSYHTMFARNLRNKYLPYLFICISAVHKASLLFKRHILLKAMVMFEKRDSKTIAREK